MSQLNHPQSGGVYQRDPLTGALTKIDPTTTYIAPCLEPAPEPAAPASDMPPPTED